MYREVSIEEQAMNASNMAFGDDRLGVLFYVAPMEDMARSQTEGRKCFRDEEFIKILIPGDHNNVVERPVQRTGILPSDDRLRFPQQYARFKQQQEQKVHDGTPLTLWPQMSLAMAKELEYFNVFTVEQLAEVADTYLHRIPAGAQWKQKAAAFVIALKDQEQVNRMTAELAQRDTEIAALKEAVADQAEKIEALLKKVK